MLPFSLPDTLEINGASYPIRTDYRDVLRVLLAFDDPDLTDAERMELLLDNIYINFREIPTRDLEEAIQAAVSFIDAGQESGDKSARSMDWEQDAPLIFPAINRVAGREVRSDAYLHWWTFTGYFIEIHDSIFSSVLSLRQKRNNGKKLEKHEREFWQKNKKICELKRKLSEEQKEEKERFKQIADSLF